ncbi:MAG: NAD(P)-dependent alcohol dehydrogenase [SAR202 cluster bacterium]|nr:NAD(P)-dependent alcohol dehydrogenase [SAR202 cluster bacterium]
MRAWELRPPFGIDGLTPVDRPERTPGHGQVTVRVRAVSLNHRDLSTVQNAAQRQLRPGLVPCSDGAGEVVAVGEGVTRVKVGDRVAGIFMQTWLAGEMTPAHQRSALGGAIDGMLAQQVVLHEDGLVHVPPHLSYEEASCLPCAGVTAWQALVTRGGIKAGDTILTQGTGGVSIFALQFGRMHGTRVLSTSSSDQKLARLHEMGANEGINYKTGPEWGKRAREMTGGAGVDHVVEVAGTLGQSVEAARIGGTVSIIGAVGGREAVNSGTVLSKQLRLQGIYVGSREMFEAMNRAITVHSTHPVIDRVFPFAETREAFRHMESGAHFGKIVISV